MRAVSAVILGATVLAAGAVLALRQRGRPPETRGLAIPPIRAKIELNGELDEDVWHTSARTAAFPAPGSTEAARPYSDARLMRDGENLYVGLYAADQDLRRGRDAFRLAFIDPRDGSTLTLSISVDKQVLEKRVTHGIESTWGSGVRLAVDFDGTLDDPSDEDEEWVVEAAIPLASLGVTPATRELRASFARCDTPKGAPTHCGAWGVGADGGIAGVLLLTP